MYLLTILAYVIVFWYAEAPSKWCLVRENDVLWTLVIVLLQPVVLSGVAYVGACRARRLLASQDEGPPAAQHYHHRLMFWLRAGTIVGFAVSVFGTRWPGWFSFDVPALQIVGDVMVLTPYAAAVLVVWVAAYPIERDLRAEAMAVAAELGRPATRPWRLGSYLDFNVRHHILIVAVPMTLILFAANMTRAYEGALRDWSGRLWLPDALLGLVALGVFLVTPIMLTRVWRTASLEPGLIRTRLEELCHTIGIRARDILIWQSDGMTINAAVMGVFAPIRYVLLSDGLLATMDAQQIAAVFGHEAGHVRHHHIQHLLVFAYVGWLLAAALMEVAARAALDSASDGSSAAVVQGIQALGVAVTALYWGFGFGWLSRRFERQADLFGARCMASDWSECARPCSVHPDEETVLPEAGRVCATGAARFASALDRVATLNGIPPEERSWRHSSVGSRIRFLASVAGDPARGIRFERMIRRVKAAALATAVLGSTLWVYYWTVVSEPGIMRLEVGRLRSTSRAAEPRVGTYGRATTLSERTGRFIPDRSLGHGYGYRCSDVDSGTQRSVGARHPTDAARIGRRFTAGLDGNGQGGATLDRRDPKRPVSYEVGPETGLATNPRDTRLANPTGLGFYPNGVIGGRTGRSAPRRTGRSNR